MNILAIDTTTRLASVAVLNDNNIIEKSKANEVTHSEKLLPLIDETLKEANLTLKDIKLYACINGPGSFTGIRIGLATIKAFSMIDNNKTFSIESTKLIAYKAFKLYGAKEVTIASIIDARNDRVYYAVYKLTLDKDEKIKIETVIPIANDEIDVAIKSITSLTTSIIFAGDCIDKFNDKLTNDSPKLYNLYPSTTDLIHAYFDITNTDSYLFDTYTLDAIYARPTQAERMKNGNK
ncbi:MAG: tRNA (adenosine(37)-N6)-threonylcarbamoyltransferase complex dimerization subunit type 1 TsaB [Clostridia bacterium]|nr:tRNA (adenosine(37)-N6)-threonylcarbamoyltransferase complex dimerization subunit type 1 TsaB [Clostridia bacterium]